MIRFTVLGVAQPAGSKRAFVIPGKAGARPRAVVTDDNARSKPWKQEVAAVAAQAMWRRPIIEGPVRLDVVFYRVRPKGHVKRDGNLTAAGLRETWPATKPDRTKLLRGLEDALRGIVWRDDAQVVDGKITKAWGAPARAEVLVMPL